MGMRATIGYIDTDKTMKLTSIQWSTALDRTLGFYAACDLKNGENPVEGVRELAKYITDHYNHIGALDINTSGGSKNQVHLAHEVYAINPQERETDYKVFSSAESDSHRVSARNFHLDYNSIGVLVDANSTSESIEFFYIGNKTDLVQCSMLSVYELAEFYATADTDLKLMPIPFRN